MGYIAENNCCTTKIQGTICKRYTSKEVHSLYQWHLPLKLCSLQPVWLYKTILLILTIFIYCATLRGVFQCGIMTLRPPTFSWIVLPFSSSLSISMLSVFESTIIRMLKTPDWSSSLLFKKIYYFDLIILLLKFQFYLPFILLMFSFLTLYLFSKDSFICSLNVSFFNIFIFFLFLW